MLRRKFFPFFHFPLDSSVLFGRKDTAKLLLALVLLLKKVCDMFICTWKLLVVATLVMMFHVLISVSPLDLSKNVIEKLHPF